MTGTCRTFSTLAEQAVQAFRGPELGTWLDRLETEHDNLRAALSWARARAQGEEGLQLAAALAPFWEFRGHIAEGRRRLEEMLAAFQGSPRVRARALNAAGILVLRARRAPGGAGPVPGIPGAAARARRHAGHGRLAYQHRECAR